MRLVLFIMLAAIGGVAVEYREAVAQEGSPARSAAKRADALAAESGKLIAFELVLVERAPDQLGGDKGRPPTVAQIAELEKQGKLGSVQRLKLVALENTEARLQLGESSPLVTGRTLRGGPGGGFPGQESITYIDLGTMLNITAKVEADGKVIAAIQLTRTSLAPTKAAEKVEGQEHPPLVVQRRLTSMVSTTARIGEGETAVIAGQQTLTGATPSDCWVLISAKVQ